MAIGNGVGTRNGILVKKILGRGRMAVAGVIAMAVAGAAAGQVRADTVAWSGVTSGTWSVATNWTTDAGHNPPTASDIASFTLGANPNQPNIAAATSIGGLSFTGTGPTTLSASSGTLTIGSSGISMADPVSGIAGVVTISAPVAISASQLWQNTSSSLLTISGTTATNGWDLTLSTTLGGASGGITWAGTNVRDNNGLKTLTLDGANTGIVTITGTYVTGDGTFVKNGTLKAGGAISIDGSLTLGSLGNAATLDLNGNSITVGGLAVDGAATPANQIITNTGGTGKILTVDTTLANSTFSGIIQNGGASTIGLTKAGINTLTLSGVNTYNGITSGTRGTLEFQGQAVGVTQSLGALAFTTGGINIQSTYGTSGTTTLAFTGTLTRTAGAIGDFILSGGNSSNNIITVGTTVTTAGGAISSPGFFFGTGANTQYAVQTLGVISGFTGGTPITNINTGLTPTVNYVSSSFSASSTLSANASANTLQYTGPAQTITTNGNKLILNGILNTGTGKLSITGSSTTDGVVAGSGELVLNAANGDIELGTLTGFATGNTVITIAGPNNLYLNQVNDASTGTITFDNGSATSVNGLVVIGASRTLSLNHPTGAGGITFSAAIADSPTGSSSVIATGAGTGTFSLAAGNTFTGRLINESSADINATNGSSLSRDNDVVVNAGGAFTAGISGGIYIAGLDDMAPGQSGITGGNVAAATSGMSFDLAGTGNYSFSGVISSTEVALVKTGSGTQNLSGKNSFSNAGGTSVNGGILNLDFSQIAATGIHPLTNILYNGVAAGILSLGGGTLVLTGGSTAANSQAFSSLTVGAGGAHIQLVPNASTPESLLATFTTIGESAGGTVDFTLPGTTAVNQTAANGITTVASANSGTTGILGGWATVGGADWATSVSNGSTFNIDPLPSASYTTFVGTGAGDTATVNSLLAVSGTVSTTAATDTVNSLKIAPSGSGSLAIATGKTLVLTSGGLLFTGSSDYSITGADATSKLNGTNLIIQQFAAHNNLTIGAVITGTTLTKSGPGTLTLTAANATTGTVNLNGGITNINALAALGTGTVITFNGGTLQYASPSAASPFSGSGDITTRTINFNGNGAVIDTNGNNIVYNNVNSATAPSFGNAGAGGFTKTGSGTLTLTGVSAYFGPTTISGGVLSIGGGATIAGQNRLVTTLNNGDGGYSLGDVAGLYIGQSITGPLIHGGAAFITAINTTTGLVTYTGGSGGNSSAYFAGFSPLGDGGMTNSSSIGVSSPAAANLILDGGTLQYTGLAQSTNRLFTITSNGGGLDASGSGALTFSSPGAIVFGSGTPTLTLTGSNTANNTLNPVIGNGPSGVTSVAKSGAGTWVLAGANTYTGNTTIGWTSALVPNGGTLKLGGASNNIAGSPIITVGTKAGDGSVLDVTGITGGFTLGAAQTLAGHGTVNGAVATVSSNHISPGNGAGVVGTLTFSTGLTLAGGVNLDYDFGPALAGHTFVTGSSDSVAVTGAAGSLNFTAPVTLNLATGSANFTGSGSYELFSYTTAGAVGTFTPGDGVTGSIVLGSSFSSLSGDTFTIANDVTAQGIFLDFAPISSGVPAGNGTWHNGSGDGKWTTNTASGSNWNVGIPNAADQVATFDDSANGGAGTVDLDGDKTVGGINLFTASAGYTIGLAGTTNTLNFQTTTGNAKINVTGAGSHTLNALSNLVNTTDVSVAAGGSLNMVGAVSGAGALTLTGGGTLTLSSAAGNSYGGGTTVNGGTLIVSNTSGGSATGAGDVTMNGGTLGGAGSISGNVVAGSGLHTIAPSAGLSPTSTTNLTVGGLTTSTNTTLSFNLNGGVVSDLGVSDTITAGTVTLNGGNIVIANNSTTGASSLGYYKLISYTTLLGTGAANLTLSAPAGGLGVVYTLDTTHAGSIDVHRGFLGDANDDGVVNFSDFVALSNHFGSTVAGWSGGDFNADGVVNFSDFVALSNHFGATILPTSESVSDGEVAEFDVTSSSFFGSSSVPEPTSLALLGLGAVALLKRRRKA